MKIYTTHFMLNKKVKDFAKARDYLLKEDMIQYMHYHCPQSICDKVVKIEWNLITENAGMIVLWTKENMLKSELYSISKFVKGQNSDGLGEDFEQQDFGASFDWHTNEYIFEERVFDNEKDK